MVKQFLKAFALVVVFMLVWMVLLFIWLFLWGEDSSMTWIGILASFPLFVILFIPYLNFVSKQSLVICGEGKPIAKDALRQQILEINAYDAPVMVKEKRDKLIITWRYVDARWWELFVKAGMTKIYELHVKLDDSKKEAILVDVQKSVSWGSGPANVSISGGFFRGYIMEYEIGKAWGIRENFSVGNIYDYKFTTAEIKNPVVNTIVRNGWTVRFGLW